MFEPSERFKLLYEEAVAYIKKHEGFAGGKPYRCVAGYLSIGYGHVILPGEHFGDKISRAEADRLLRRDFNRCINSVYQNSCGLSDNQLIAVSHFAYAKGIGRYLKSKLKKIVDMKENPNEEFLKWCYYHTPKGKLVKSNYCLSIRKWEVYMYNNNASDHVPVGILQDPDDCEPLEQEPQAPDTLNVVCDITQSET